MSDVRAKLDSEMFCASCGEVIKKQAEICPKCGVRNQACMPENASEKDWLTTLLLNVFLCYVGAHRFYVGKIGTGVLMLLFWWATLGIWNLVDLIMIICEKFKDKEGKLVMRKR